MSQKIGLFMRTVDNLTNEGYEVKFHPYVGKGAYAMPGRSFMLGAKCKF